MVLYQKSSTIIFLLLIIINYPTRFALNSFQLPRSSNTPKFSILLRGPKLRDQFFTNIEKDITTLDTFKRLLKKQILDINNELIVF